MKKLLLLITILIILSSCDNEKPTPVDSKKETTVQIQQLAQIDSNFYKVVEIESKTYIVNKDNMVIKIKKDFSGAANTFGLAFMISLLIIFFIILMVISAY